ncbi:thermonuclease family protein [Kiloniella spongiae]|uniref:thermonuclease family protein n=1 Tax=Kiloniella spongiae TaxID=1489064 RepID=UPI00069AE21F|nr:thermonuclease family protein [Kiloniella spongiae]
MQLEIPLKVEILLLPYYDETMPTLKASIPRLFLLSLPLYGWLSFGEPVSAQETPPSFEPAFDKRVKVTAITTAHHLRLADDTTIKLAGLLLPTQQDCERLAVVCPVVEQLTSYLATTLDQQQIYIASNTLNLDRNDRLLAQVKNKESNWIQKGILQQGYGRVITTTAHPTDLKEMLRIEDQARVAQKGIWHLKAFQVLKTDNLNTKTDRFQIIEGTIQKTAEVRGTVYLNFGQDWRKDFTIKLEKNHRTSFVNKGKNLLEMVGKRVRIRGWLFWENGPMISLYTPEQLEFLSTE